MLPVILDISALKVVLIGDGLATKRRLKMLQDAGCEPMQYSETPGEGALFGADIVFIADFDKEITADIYAAAKKAGALVNAEDIADFCDFNMPAIVRRGDLLLTASTNGQSPRLARCIKQKLAAEYGEEWGGRVAEIGKKREKWRADGAGFEELVSKTDALIDGEGWL